METNASLTRFPDGTVTFVLTDVEGSSSRWEADPLSMAATMRAHDVVVDDVVRRCAGMRPVEQGEGDSVVLVFSRASDALRAALELQRGFASIPETAGSSLRVRIGVHSGEASPSASGRYAGPAVNRCARIRGLAHGGQVLVSAATAGLVADQLPAGASLHDLGAVSLRGLTHPERLCQLTHPALAAGFPPVHGVGGLRGAQVLRSSFVGREVELVELRRLLDAHALVTLTGAGGTGKTRLAVELGTLVASEFPSGAWFVDLASINDVELVARTVADVLDVRIVDQSDADAARLITDRLRRGRCLLILDNCEHLLDDVATLVEMWCSVAPELRVLTTSREPIGVPGEVVWRVASLACPPRGVAADDVESFDAARLFVERSRAVGTPFELDDDRAEQVAAICRRLDGLPLAIELAASRTRSMSVAEIAGRLDDRFRLLRGASRTASARQRTLEASVGWSYRLASPVEQRVLARCSVFVGGFDQAAATTVTELDSGTVVSALAGLVDHSLLVADQALATTRYRMLETIQHFAAARLDETDEAAACRDRHAAHFLSWAERLGPLLEGPDGPATEQLLLTERDNLGAAYEWMARVDPCAAARLAVALQRHWSNRGPGGDGLATLRSILSPPSQLTPDLRVAALAAAVEIAFSSGRLRLATALGEEAIELAAEVGDLRLEGRVRAILASILNWSDPAAGAVQAREALRCASAAGDDWGLADAITSDAQHHVLIGDYTTARARLSDALAIASRLRSPHLQSYITFYLALVAVDQGAPERFELLRAAMAHGRDAGDALLVGLVARLSGLASSAAGDHEAARAAVDAARRAMIDIDWASVQVEHAAGDLGAANEAIERTAAGAVSQSVASRIVWHLAAARTKLASGDMAAAIDDAHAAHADASAARYAFYRARAELVLGQIARRAVREPKTAEEHLHRALEQFADARCRPWVCEVLDELAAVAADLDSLEEAARLLGAADALRSAIGTVRTVPDAEALAVTEEKVRYQLGERAFDNARAAGARLRWEDAVAYVRRARGERRRPTCGWDSLTPTERQVAELVVDGLTNPQIAQRLLIGSGTVKSHLSHVFRKLGIARRSQLAAEVTRRSLDLPA